MCDDSISEVRCRPRFCSCSFDSEFRLERRYLCCRGMHLSCLRPHAGLGRALVALYVRADYRRRPRPQTLLLGGNQIPPTARSRSPVENTRFRTSDARITSRLWRICRCVAILRGTTISQSATRLPSYRRPLPPPERYLRRPGHMDRLQTHASHSRTLHLLRRTSCFRSRTCLFPSLRPRRRTILPSRCLGLGWRRLDPI